MCGIVGYIGKQQSYPFLIQGLKKLEYRGYDSAGLAIVDNGGNIQLHKSVGKVTQLEACCNGAGTEGSVGIAHTRWATHGVPNTRNAHPHLSSDGRVAIVHNGTIENYTALKNRLTDLGYTFSSDTDTEVLAQWISHQFTIGADTLSQAVRQALASVEGAYAIAVVEKGHSDAIVVAKKSSPLAIGIGEDATYIASDATPFVGYTDKVVYLEDYQTATIYADRIDITTLDGKNIEPRIDTLTLSVEQIEKGGYDSFMLKEIHEQPQRLTDCLRGRIGQDNMVHLEGVESNRDVFRNVHRIVITACGTSWHAGLIGKRLIQEFCSIPVEVEYASEFRYTKQILSGDDIVIAISQSGETADTLAAVAQARSQGAFVYYICNVVGSSIPRQADAGTYIHVGPEVGVASTKAFTGQVMALTMLALNVAQVRQTTPPDRIRQIVGELQSIPDKVSEILADEHHIARVAKKYTEAHSFLFLGREYCFPTALEGALKLKEISYIHAEGYPAAEMKHGPIALVDSTLPCVVIAPSDSLYDKIVNTVQQIVSRSGKVIAVATKGNNDIADMADDCIYIPSTHKCLVPIVASIPLQLLAYYIAADRGLDVDQPRNLAKSVTVE